jgi:hypothetical protein
MGPVVGGVMSCLWRSYREFTIFTDFSTNLLTYPYSPALMNECIVLGVSMKVGCIMADILTPTTFQTALTIFE